MFKSKVLKKNNYLLKQTVLITLCFTYSFIITNVIPKQMFFNKITQARSESWKKGNFSVVNSMLNFKTHLNFK